MPHFLATQMAVWMLSPVAMMLVILALFNSEMVSLVIGFS
jgi:hypothetical protein